MEPNTTEIALHTKQGELSQPTLGDIGKVASRYAEAAVFRDYLNRKSLNTIRAQRTDLDNFVEYLHDITRQQKSSQQEAIQMVTQLPTAEALQNEPSAWKGISWGLVDGFVRWMLAQSYAIGSINRKLSTIKHYAKLATQAGTLDQVELALIRNITSYSQKEGKRIDQRRQQTRIGEKKAQHVRLTSMLAQALKNQPDTPQGRRDRLMMCLLLDHGLRVGEVALLKVDDIDLNEGIFSFFRPKVDRKQKHRMSEDTLVAMRNWFAFGDAPATGALLRASRKDGSLWTTGMTERAITGRVALLGEQLGIDKLSAHDCRHYWATHAVQQGTDAFALKDAGGWNSIAMPSRYVEAATVANERVKI